MTRFLAGPDIVKLATREVVLDAARTAAEAGADGAAVIPPRLDVDLQRGFFRVMPGAFGELMGVKVMTNVKEVGNRYLLLLYHQSDGELLALLDADEVTRLRTAATTALAARTLQPEPQTELALIGSGFEATGHLRLLRHMWPLERVHVFSPSQERRTAFAERMSAELGIVVRPSRTCAEACSAADTVVLTTKANEPVLRAADLRPGAVVLSIGSTRPSLRELDRATLSRTAALVVDDVDSVKAESGDIIDALEHGALEPDRIVSLGASLSDGRRPRPTAARDLLTFKSVGTIVQDLALAHAVLSVSNGVGRELGELTHLKAFARGQPAS